MNSTITDSSKKHAENVNQMQVTTYVSLRRRLAISIESSFTGILSKIRLSSTLCRLICLAITFRARAPWFSPCRRRRPLYFLLLFLDAQVHSLLFKILIFFASLLRCQLDLLMREIGVANIIPFQQHVSFLSLPLAMPHPQFWQGLK